MSCNSTRKTLKIDRSGQVSLFIDDFRQGSKKLHHSKNLIFVNPDPKTILVGMESLDSYLNNAGQKDAFVIRRMLDEQDWSLFETLYKPGGRAPYAPKLMVGIILYGIIKGISSLRELENLARLDLGCMWVSGGIFPDHSVIGRFINKHSEQLSKELFVSLTKSVLEITNSNTDSVAGDGTVIQAAASRYGTIKFEAAQKAAQEAKAKSEKDPSNEKYRQKAEQSQTAAQIAEARAKQRHSKGRCAKETRISPTEPESVVQPLKTKAKAPSYKPSILANKKRVVVGVAVDGSNEVSVVKEMLEQAKKIGDGKNPQQAMFDAGYFADTVINEGLERDIDLLVPEGRSDQADRSFKKKSTKQFPKSSFEYNEITDTYNCPAGKELTAGRHYKGNENISSYIEYTTSSCANCTQREQCTKSSSGRRILRYSSDEAKDALRTVMEHPQAQLQYRQRQAMVEPVFSTIKNEQGLKRFRRRGLAGVRLEFMLHVLANNLKRALMASRALSAVIYCYIFQILVGKTIVNQRYRFFERCNERNINSDVGGKNFAVT